METWYIQMDEDGFETPVTGGFEDVLERVRRELGPNVYGYMDGCIAKFAVRVDDAETVVAIATTD